MINKVAEPQQRGRGRPEGSGKYSERISFRATKSQRLAFKERGAEYMRQVLDKPIGEGSNE